MIARLLTVVTFVVFTASATFAEPLSSCKEYEKYGRPGNGGELLCRKGYLLAYDPYFKNPIWVAEHLTGKKAKGTLARSGKFMPDPDLPKGERGCNVC